MKLFIDPEQLKLEYANAEPWLQALMIAWADGLNFYLHTHPEVKPRVISKFEPWMALSFSEGSIGGDIAKVDLGQLEAFYGGAQSLARSPASVARASAALAVLFPSLQSNKQRFFSYLESNAAAW